LAVDKAILDPLSKLLFPEDDKGNLAGGFLGKIGGLLGVGGNKEGSVEGKAGELLPTAMTELRDAVLGSISATDGSSAAQAVGSAATKVAGIITQTTGITQSTALGANTINLGILTTAMVANTAAVAAGAASEGAGIVGSLLAAGGGGGGGFHRGTDFIVGGRGGMDNNRVSMNLSKGERVRVTPTKDVGKTERPITMVFNLPNVSDSDGFRKSIPQIANTTNKTLNRASVRNG
jgi:hypothetical protein